CGQYATSSTAQTTAATNVATIRPIMDALQHSASGRRDCRHSPKEPSWSELLRGYGDARSERTNGCIMPLHYFLSINAYRCRCGRMARILIYVAACQKGTPLDPQQPISPSLYRA